MKKVLINHPEVPDNIVEDFANVHAKSVDSGKTFTNKEEASNNTKSVVDSSKLILNRIEPLLTVDDLVIIFQVPRKTIYSWIYKGNLKAIKLGPRLVRFSVKEVERWIFKEGNS